jgi:hypothetical protein
MEDIGAADLDPTGSLEGQLLVVPESVAPTDMTDDPDIEGSPDEHTMVTLTPVGELDDMGSAALGGASPATLAIPQVQINRRLGKCTLFFYY